MPAMGPLCREGNIPGFGVALDPRWQRAYRYLSEQDTVTP